MLVAFNPDPVPSAHALDRLTIAGYRSIREADLTLRPGLNLLIGANGAGKSNLLSVFELLAALVDRRLQRFVSERGGAAALLHFGPKVTSSLDVTLTFGRNGYHASLKPTADDAFTFQSEVAAFDKGGDGWWEKELAAGAGLAEGHRESKLAGSGKVEEYVEVSMRGWRPFHFHDTGRASPMRNTQQLDDNAALRADAGNLAPYLYLLQQKHSLAYGRIRDAIRQVAPFFDDFALRVNPLNEQTMRLEWRHRDDDGYFGPDSLSDGTLRFIALATLLLQPIELRPKTIVIDEPELGLHPAALRLLAAMLDSAAGDTQLVVATQSAALVDEVQLEDLLVVERDRTGRESTFRRIATQDVAAWIDEYSLGELWNKNLLGGRP